MLNTFDLYDLHAVLINIRAYPNYRLNKDIVSNIVEILKSNNQCNEFNQIRESLNTLDFKNESEYEFVSKSNVYPYVPSLVKNRVVYDILIEIFENLLDIIESDNYVKISDFADAVHNCPLILLDNNHKRILNFWKYNIMPYRKKWDKRFLRNYNLRIFLQLNNKVF